MDFEHTDKCMERERPQECVQCWQSQPTGHTDAMDCTCDACLSLIDEWASYEPA